MVTCPHEECSDSDREFESDATMRQHHTKVHDEQLPNNSCDECGDEFFDKGSANKYCDDCRHEAHYVGETAPNYSGAKEKTKCKECGEDFSYYPSDKKGVFCSQCVENGASVATSGRFGRENGADPATANGGKKSRLVELTCSVCEDTFEREEWRIRSRDAADNPVCGPECSAELTSERMKGENNPRWNGGVNWDRKYGKKWEEVREIVYERDNGCCQICETSDNELSVIHGHHIIPVDEFEEDEDAHYKENAVLVCPSCHPKVEQGKIKIPEAVVKEKNLETHRVLVSHTH